MSVGTSDAFLQKGLAWTMLTSPVFISKPLVPWSLFSPVGIWLLDGAENWWSVFWAMGVLKLALSNLDPKKISSGRMTMRQAIHPILFGSKLKWYGRSNLVLHCSAEITRIPRAMVIPLKLAVINQQILSNYSTKSLANCFPGNDARNACWRFLRSIEYGFRKHTESLL